MIRKACVPVFLERDFHKHHEQQQPTVALALKASTAACLSALTRSINFGASNTKFKTYLHPRKNCGGHYSRWIRFLVPCALPPLIPLGGVMDWGGPIRRVKGRDHPQGAMPSCNLSYLAVEVGLGSHGAHQVRYSLRR